MRYARTMGSCGVRHIYDLPRDPVRAVIGVQKKLFVGTPADGVYNDRCAMICFSDVTRGGNGSRIAEYITEKKLGKVVASDSTRNPNSGNRITVWIWHVDAGALERFEA